MRAVLALALKDVRLLLRDRPSAFFTFAFPLAIALFFGYVFGGTTAAPMRVAVACEDRSPAAERFLRAVADDPSLDAAAVADRAAGEREVRAGRAAALVVVPAGFGEGADAAARGGTARLEAVVDPSRRAEGAMLVGKLHEVAFATVFAALPEPRWRPVEVALAELETGPGAGGFGISFMQGIAWALFGAVSAFASGFAEERERGTLVRLVTSPMRPWQMLLGKGLACAATCMATQWLLLATGAAFFGVSVARPAEALAATSANAFAFTGVMMVLAAAFRTQGSAHGAGRAILLVLTMVGGGTVPLVFMPPFLQAASDASPFKWAVLAVEGATWRAWPASELWVPLAVLTGIGLAGLAAGSALLRRSVHAR
jgi:ABC-2 type transport system permease protein